MGSAFLIFIVFLYIHASSILFARNRFIIYVWRFVRVYIRFWYEKYLKHREKSKDTKKPTQRIISAPPTKKYDLVVPFGQTHTRPLPISTSVHPIHPTSLFTAYLSPTISSSRAESQSRACNTHTQYHPCASLRLTPDQNESLARAQCPERKFSRSFFRVRPVISKSETLRNGSISARWRE